MIFTSNSISYCRQFGAADYDSIISFLLDIDWLMLQQSCSVDEFWNAFSMYLNECIERFVPIRIVSRKPPCLKRIRKLLLLKKQWYHKDIVVYKKIARVYTNLHAVQSFYESHEQNIIRSNNLSRLYSYVNSKLPHISTVPPLIKTNGSLATTDPDKCNVFNAYFASVFTTANGVFPCLPSKGFLSSRNINKLSLHIIKCFVLLSVFLLNTPEPLMVLLLGF